VTFTVFYLAFVLLHHQCNRKFWWVMFYWVGN